MRPRPLLKESQVGLRQFGGALGATLSSSADETQGLIHSMAAAPKSAKAQRALVKRSKAKAYKIRKK